MLIQQTPRKQNPLQISRKSPSLNVPYCHLWATTKKHHTCSPLVSPRRPAETPDPRQKTLPPSRVLLLLIHCGIQLPSCKLPTGTNTSQIPPLQAAAPEITFTRSSNAAAPRPQQKPAKRWVGELVGEGGRGRREDGRARGCPPLAWAGTARTSIHRRNQAGH